MNVEPPVESRAFDPDGAVFVSYRQADGSPLAERVAWVLRGCGLPVWIDKHDLLPGDFRERITQAFDEGISAAVIVITPDIENSAVVRNVEVPRLLELHRLEPRFSLAVVNGISDHDRAIDHGAPDRLLSLNDEPLRNTKQYEPTDEGLARLAVEMARRRVTEFRRLGLHRLPIDIQTRSTPQAADARTGLVVRYRPNEGSARIPPSDAWKCVRVFLASAPQLMEASGASQLEVTGGAHLSIAFGLGVAFPRVRHIPVSVIDSVGQWDSVPDRKEPDLSLNCAAESVSAGAGRLAAYVDVAEHAGDRTAFDNWLDANRSVVHRRLVVQGPEERLAAASGQRLAEQIEGAIRDNSLPLGHGHVDLFLRASFPVAVLLGRLLNTHTITMYEWDNSTSPASYIPAATYDYGTDPLAAVLQVDVEEP